MLLMTPFSVIINLEHIFKILIFPLHGVEVTLEHFQIFMEDFDSQVNVILNHHEYYEALTEKSHILLKMYFN